MTALQILTILIILLITAFIILKARKKDSGQAVLTSLPETPEPLKQQPEEQSTDNVEPSLEAQPEEPNAPFPEADISLSVTASPSELETSPAPPEADASSSKAASCLETNSSLPQDSILRRHYLTHLRTMIESVAPARPTDSVLCRHHDTLVATKIDQCLHNTKAMEQLIKDYEDQ